MISNIIIGAPRIRLLFNSGLKFIKGNISQAANIIYDDSNSEKVNLPHGWNNPDGHKGGNYYSEPAWYGKSFKFPENVKGKKIFIKFVADNMSAGVFIKGKFACEHTGGYAAFTFDITGFLNVGGDFFK